MKKQLILAIMLFTIGMSYGQTSKVTEKSFPTNFDQSKFNKIQKFKDSVIAYDAKILEIKNSRNNTPFYKLKLGKNHYLWTVLMFKNEGDVIGDKISMVI